MTQETSIEARYHIASPPPRQPDRIFALCARRTLCFLGRNPAMGKHAKIAERVAAWDRTTGWHPCYVEYFRLFNAQAYYEAHDILEHIWLETDGELYTFYKALIQFAGGFVHLQHHHREPAHRIHGRRLQPAARLFRRAAELLAVFPERYEGLIPGEIITMATGTAASLESSDFAVNPWHPDRAPRLQPPV